MALNIIKKNLRSLQLAEHKILEIQGIVKRVRRLLSSEQYSDVQCLLDDYNLKSINIPIIGSYEPELPSLDFKAMQKLPRAQADKKLNIAQHVLCCYISEIEKTRNELLPILLFDSLEEIEIVLDTLKRIYLGKELPSHQQVEDSSLPRLKERILDVEECLRGDFEQLDSLANFKRHLSYGEVHDLEDIIKYDWPGVKQEILQKKYFVDGLGRYEERRVSDLKLLVERETERKRLNWKDVTPEQFERLVFQMVSLPEATYENAEFLMRTHASDRGRDISVYRVSQDSFSGTIRHRVIIQCKHWPERSVSVKDFSYLKDQISLWEPPRIDVLIVATTGYFSADAVKFMENHNQSSSPLRIEFWPVEKIKEIMSSYPNLLDRFRI